MMYQLCFLVAVIVAVSADADPSYSSCSYVCNRKFPSVYCNKWQIRKVLKVKVGYCWCKKVICVPKPLCHYHGKYLRIGQTFRKGCLKCTCKRNRRVVCRSVCPRKVNRCNKYEKAIWVRYRYDNYCYCKKYKCVPNKCHYRHRYYYIGQKFRVGCNKCICKKNGRVSCRSVCPRKVNRCNKYEKAIWVQYRYDNYCYCKKYKCVPNKCHYRHRYYYIGQKFRVGCNKCICKKNGRVSCRSVCPRKVNRCNKYEKAIWVRYRYDNYCYCKKYKCVPNKCHYRHRYYYIGQKFRVGCNKCICKRNGKVSCRSVCPRKVNTCNKYERAVWVRYQYDNYCYCKKYKCLPKFCKYYGRYIRVGTHFITKNCRKRCWCLRNGHVRCVPLCKRVRIPKCPYYYSVKSHYKVVSRHPYCRCVVSRKCVKRSHYFQ